MADYYNSNAYQQQQQSSGNPYENINSYGNTSSANDPYSQQHQQSQQGNQQQWKAPNNNQNQHQSQQPSAAAGGTTPFWNPAMASTFASVATATATNNPNAMFDLGLKAGHTFLDQGTARMIPGLERTMRELRVYFAVNNSYVHKKMRRVLFSFFFKNWKRVEKYDASIQGSANNQKYALPTEDDNALDLYIPSMSLITYVLLCGLCYGTSGQFDPEVLPDVTTKCVVIQIVEVLVFRLGFYLMQAPISFMELFAVTGYKYLGLTFNMLIGYSLSLALVSGGQKGYYAMFLWNASAASYFMLKYMANNTPVETANSGPKREFVLLGFAASQFLSMWILGQTKFLN